MTLAPPAQLLLGVPEHGVVAYAADVASQLRRLDDRTRVESCVAIDDAIVFAASEPRVHLHVTDRLLGRSPEEAADNLERIASVTRLTITIHDVPQNSDGTPLPRRIAAYARFITAAEGTVVNSRHEQHLVAEFLSDEVPTDKASTHAIPLGTRTPSPRAPIADVVRDDADLGAGHDLVVLIAGFVYPGKGHAQAIRAAASAAADLRAGGERVGEAVVRAVGRASDGHEYEIDQLRADAAAHGIRFEVTGYLADDAFTHELLATGIPLAAHEHVSASRSQLDWMEAGRRALVVDSRYATEMAQLRPRTTAVYDPADLAVRLAGAWRDPSQTWLEPGTSLAPSLADVAEDYLRWWRGRATP